MNGARSIQESLRPEDPGAADFAWQGIPPLVKNKYFCGNLQIITRLCETLNRTTMQQAATTLAEDPHKYGHSQQLASNCVVIAARFTAIPQSNGGSTGAASGIRSKSQRDYARLPN